MKIHDNPMTIYTIAFCPNPKKNYFATAGQDSIIRVYDPKNDNLMINEITDNKAKVFSLSFNYNYLASGGLDEILRVYSVNDNF